MSLIGKEVHFREWDDSIEEGLIMDKYLDQGDQYKRPISVYIIKKADGRFKHIPCRRIVRLAKGPWES